MSEVKSGLAGLTHLSPAAPLLSSSLLFHCYHPRSHSSKQELLQILKNVKKKKKKMGTHLTSPRLEMPQTSVQPIHGFGHGDLGLPMPGREAGKGL